MVSIVIVSWNRKEDVLDAIESIRTQDHSDYEIVVVDNGSQDGTVEALRELHPDVRVVALDRNSGVSEGRNIGVAAARGEIVFFLDSDATVGRRTLDTIVDRLGSKSDVGVIACKILKAGQDPPQISNWVYSERHKSRHDTEFDSYSFSECGVAVRRSVFNEVGGFWNELFFGREGEDLSLRILDAGYRIVYQPDAVVYHRWSPSERVDGGRREAFDLQNALSIYLVRYRWTMLARFIPLRIGVAFVRGLRRGHPGPVIGAVVRVARKLPSLWRQRRPISRATAEYYLTLQRAHGALSWDLTSWLKHKT